MQNILFRELHVWDTAKTGIEVVKIESTFMQGVTDNNTDIPTHGRLQTISRQRPERLNQISEYESLFNI